MVFVVGNMSSEINWDLHDKIHRRSGHITFVYKGYMLLWGGYMENFPNTSNVRTSCEYHSTDELWAYDIHTEVWSRITTKGEIPPRNSGACGVVHDDFLYVFGGYHGVSDNHAAEGNSNQLHRLDLTSMVWKQLYPGGVAPTPCDKLVGWVYNEKLYFFGGFGPAPDIWAPLPFEFVPDQSLESNLQRGWNNQLVSLDVRFCREYLMRGEEVELHWEWPHTTGTIPRPRAAHAADICGSKLYIFGGRLLFCRMNDLHCLDMETMHWSGDMMKFHNEYPEGRSWHSLTFIREDKAILYGGFNQFDTILRDCWLLEVPSMNWELLFYGRPRLWHRAEFLTTGDLMIIGGHKDSITNPIKRVEAVKDKIIHGNGDLPGIQDGSWSLNLVHDPHQRNAFVLPNKSIFVFTGMLDVCSNEDQLAMILAHEMSHVIMSHMEESLSKTHFIQLLLILPVLLLWVILPNEGAVFFHWLTDKITHLMIDLPFSRNIEKEADEVGLMMIAKACYDVREASKLWEKIDKISADKDEEKPIEWLSTHPSFINRKIFIDEQLPIAIRIREECNCPPLSRSRM
ncbi:hypothetical protein J437_LFUL005388 [Ladona fulva]|uniref:Peptidase M48 domain-containing protein n=1 Tax=Ladona fulva TaxID=123851 RepID=A0A8K0K3L6_LADFU|nr:hypothetical protein J437_LFUL005388 [Ladona fulva]